MGLLWMAEIPLEGCCVLGERVGEGRKRKRGEGRRKREERRESEAKMKRNVSITLLRCPILRARWSHFHKHHIMPGLGPSCSIDLRLESVMTTKFISHLVLSFHPGSPPCPLHFALRRQPHPHFYCELPLRVIMTSLVPPLLCPPVLAPLLPLPDGTLFRTHHQLRF